MLNTSFLVELLENQYILADTIDKRTHIRRLFKALQEHTQVVIQSRILAKDYTTPAYSSVTSCLYCLTPMKPRIGKYYCSSACRAMHHKVKKQLSLRDELAIMKTRYEEDRDELLREISSLRHELQHYKQSIGLLS